MPIDQLALKESSMTRENKVKSILVTLDYPESGKSVFDVLPDEHKIKLDYRSFIHVEPVHVREMRNQQLNILDHTAVILTSRSGVDNFFRIAEEMRVELPTTFKYFCSNSAITNYIQKYITVRKRKMFTGKGPLTDLLRMVKAHKKEKFIFTCSNIRKPMIPDFLDEQEIDYTEAVMYKTVSSDLSDLEEVFYDIIVFYSPADIKSLFENFPDYEQNNTRIAAFGNSTKKAIEEAGLILDIFAPTPENPSIVTALQNYCTKVNKR